MQKRAVVKIDICGSTEYIDSKESNEDNVRERLLKELHEFVKGIFPDSDKPYPEGSVYSAQGDSLYIILDRPTVAVLSTIEFMKGWYGKLPALPDCRAVLDYGKIHETRQIKRLELLGEPFENISKIEKYFKDGQIGVTSKIIEESDLTLVQYIRPVRINISAKRSIETYLASYDDPRLIYYSNLARIFYC